jgi:hypothetical protein
MSNTRRLKPRDPDEVESAFRAALGEGCPHCGSRRVVGRFHDGLWDYGLRCEASCRTFAEPRLAHRIASEAAGRAAAVTGQRLRYEAFDGSCGQIEGAVRALAGG